MYVYITLFNIFYITLFIVFYVTLFVDFLEYILCYILLLIYDCSGPTMDGSLANGGVFGIVKLTTTRFTNWYAITAVFFAILGQFSFKFLPFFFKPFFTIFLMTIVTILAMC